MEQLKNLLNISINKAGIKRQVQAAQICTECEKIIKTLDQKSLHQCKPYHYKNKILTISTPSSAHAQEILMHQHIIKEKINQHFNQTAVTRIQFKLF